MSVTKVETKPERRVLAEVRGSLKGLNMLRIV